MVSGCKGIWCGAALIGTITLLACASAPEPEDGERTVLVDRTGKEWDVTHAVDAYDMEEDRFQHGLGPDTIRPVNTPSLIGPGDEGYPNPDEDFRVLGVIAGGVARAYRIRDLRLHEVANDIIGGAIVSSAY